KSLFITEKVEHSWEAMNIIIDRSINTIRITESWTFGDYGTFFYRIGVLIFLIQFVFRLIKVQRLLNACDVKSSFSFFYKIKIDYSQPQSETILVHEKVHAKQLHSVDVIFFELLAIVNWFNPVVYLYKTAIKQIHEFIADEIAIEAEGNKKE